MTYGSLIALAVMATAGFLIAKAKYITPGLLIFLSAGTMLTLRIINEITYSQDLVQYINDENGEVLAAKFELTIWESASQWADPSGLMVISFSLLFLAKKLHSYK